MTTPAMLSWTPELALHDPRTDATHQEFIELLNAAACAAAADKTRCYQALLEHTVEHFAQEERWMLATGISAGHCHFGQHADVLQVMKEIERRALIGEIELIDRMAEALAEWFPGHAQSMDAGLVAHLQQQGFDTATETLVTPVTH
jgi:hemerythrin